ncbi:MAG TPA: response regulator, partial [Acidobacteriota bacterium]|nr:response regulator [Acidobacteriota bacterium]
MAEQYLDPLWIEHGYGTRFQGFQNLMRRRIRDVLLVSSLYDLYLFEEDGRLYELIRNEYLGLNLSHSPELTRVSSGKEALSLAKEERRFDLIVTTLHIEDMSALRLAKLVREAGLDVPIVLMAYDNRELKELTAHHDTSIFNRIFIWQGDFRLIIGIIKHLEDRMNVDHDTRIAGVQSIILIEDNVRYYSSFLPIIYTEILKQSQRLISEGINLSHRYLRMRARPKILLCETYEEAWDYYIKYEDYILGIISDIDFPRNGEPDPKAGLTLARQVKSRYPDIPILLQSLTPAWE